MYYNSGEQKHQILSLHRKRKIKHLSFFLHFSIAGIKLLIHGNIEVRIRQNNEKDKKPLTDVFTTCKPFFVPTIFFCPTRK